MLNLRYPRKSAADHSRDLPSLTVGLLTRLSRGILSPRVTRVNLRVMTSNWRHNLINDSTQMRELLTQTKTIAVLGIKTEAQSNQPAFYVPSYMQNAGFKIIPVPVYYPEVTEILGETVHRTLAEIPGDVDMVNVFRRPQDIPPHVDDIIAKIPKSVWMQLGIYHDEVARQLAEAGIKVVQDRCLMVDHRRLMF